MSLGCLVHYSACTVQPNVCTAVDQVFTFARVGWLNIMQMRMLHQGGKGSLMNNCIGSLRVHLSFQLYSRRFHHQGDENLLRLVI